MKERQKRFVDAYIQTGNAALSARQAGYSPKTSAVQGARMLRNANVQAEIEKRLEEVRNVRTAGLEETLEIVTAVLRGELYEENALAISGKNARIEKVKTAPKIKDRLKAAELLMKVHGTFREKEETADEPIKIIIARAGEVEEN